MKRKRVFNRFQVNLIVFYVASVLMVPIFIVFAYMFDLHNYTSTNKIVLIASIFTLIFYTGGLTLMLLTRDKYERKLKPSYPKEFMIVNVFSGFGIIGIGIFYTYLGGSFFYVPHVIIPLFIGVYTAVFYVGDRVFHVRIIKK